MTYYSFKFERISNFMSSIKRPIVAKCDLFSFTAQANSVWDLVQQNEEMKYKKDD